jgi:histidine triad (HIT) family protein
MEAHILDNNDNSNNCIFCKIANGSISASIIDQNNRAIAFLDAFPLSAGHTLIIPKSHYSKVQDMNKEDSSDVFNLLWKLSGAVEKAAGVDGSTIAIHNGKAAGQEVPHVHIHVIPRTTGDGAGPVHSMFKKRPNTGSKELNSILEKIKKELL